VRIVRQMKLRPLPATSAGPAPAVAATSQAQRRQIRSDELFSGQREVLIEHSGEIYSLRQTSKGKLILTK
jgi:hemin uptake protein HemP